MAVVVRPDRGRPAAVLVYPGVAEGDYVLVVIGDESARRGVHVEGGVVTTDRLA